MKCNKCGRSHSGQCGIPRRTSIGGELPRKRISSDGIPHSTAKGTGVLENLLSEAQNNQGKVMEMLKVLPPSVREYAELLDREGRLDGLIKTLVGQIAAKSGVK